jgi:hypothetical protein
MIDIACKLDVERIVISDRPAVPRESALHAALAQETETPPTWQYFSDVFDGARTLTRISLPVYSSVGVLIRSVDRAPSRHPGQ